MKEINGTMTLTVEELIEKLQKFRKTRKVLIYDDNGKSYNAASVSKSNYRNCIDINTECRID